MHNKSSMVGGGLESIWHLQCLVCRKLSLTCPALLKSILYIQLEDTSNSVPFYFGILVYYYHLIVCYFINRALNTLSVFTLKFSYVLHAHSSCPNFSSLRLTSIIFALLKVLRALGSSAKSVIWSWNINNASDLLY